MGHYHMSRLIFSHFTFFMGWVASEITKIGFPRRTAAETEGAFCGGCFGICLELRYGNNVFVCAGDFGVVGA